MTILVPVRSVLAGGALSLLLAAGVSQAQTTQLSALHDALHLTAEQENAWRRYTAAVRPDPYAAALHQAAQRMMASLPTPRRVELINAEVDEDAAAVHHQGEAVKAFYTILTPDQQRTFDRQTAQAAGQAQPGRDDEGISSLRQPPGGQLPSPGRP